MSTVDIVLAFAEGLAVVISPCILPVLPLVLGASALGGRRRPYGIIVGFILSFTAFAFGSRWLIGALGLDLDLVKSASYGLLAALALVLIIPALSRRFARLTSGMADRAATLSTRMTGDGFISGVGLGGLIGLVWTPCAGPVLAAVLVQIIRQESDAQGLVTVLAFASGAGVPMLLFALLGRKVLQHLTFIKQHSEGLQRAFGVLILFGVGLLASGVDPQRLFTPAPMIATAVAAPMIEDGLTQPYAAPELKGVTGWLNSQPLTLADLKGKVVLVDFWTYSCINCIRTLPHITEWDAKYRDKGLVIIGVHAPEFAFEKKTENVQAALQQYGIRYPVAQDNNLDTWTNFNNRYWPAHYLIDRNGQVVYTHFGEGKYDVTERNIQKLLGEKAAAAATDDASPFSAGQTPETYLGSARAANFSGTPALLAASAAEEDFHAATTLPRHHWSLNGAWQVADDKITSAATKAELRLHFVAKKVFLVLGTADNQPQTVQLALNGKPLPGDAATLTVTGHRLYQLVELPALDHGELTLTASRPGLEAYAFTFGS
jgi:cytochrome c biogenesis protein CcdA/thiol-disulfide isomerase/thioredoxin